MTNTKPDSSWLRTFSIGFSIISFGITLAIIGYIILNTKQNQTPNQPSPTSTIDETANWKTYHTSFGISFKTPPSYIVHDNNSKIIQIASNETVFGHLSQHLTIDARLTAIYKDYDAAVKVLLLQFPKNDTTHITQAADKITIKQGPYKSNISSLKNEGNLYQENIYWKYNNGAITASFHNVSSGQTKTYEQILSTFRFTQ